MTQAHLVLADGTVFPGTAMGAAGSTTGEVVFTTGMTGYQEVLTDPSYCSQLVVMTAPEIGNTGVNERDEESRGPALSGFVVHDLSSRTSNWRATASLEDYLKKHGVVGIRDVDTRALTRHIRDHGAQMGAIGTEDVATLHDRAKAAPPMTGRDLTDEVSTDRAYEWTEGTDVWGIDEARPLRWNVVALDFGMKVNQLRCMVDAGCKVTVVPGRTSAQRILDMNPDGIFVSNGPGDPAAVEHGVATVRELLGKRPMFGICLGHQLVSLALGASTYKLKFGHHGLNQPVKDLVTGRVEVTTQNHGFCVDTGSLPKTCEVTHLHLNDGTCEGIRQAEANVFSVQYHPEASAGPHDAHYLFDRFIRAIEDTRA